MAEHPTRRGWMLVVGIVLLLVGLLGAGALWFAGGQRIDENVAGFARAPAGCATTLDFERAGNFTLYVETKGTVDDLPGDCAAAAAYDRTDVSRPELVVVDPEGSPVGIESDPGSDYDTGSFVGSSVGLVRIEAPGDYVLTVQPDGAPFAIAVGGDPNDGVALMRWGAVAVAIVGLIAGGIFLVLGSRRPPDAATEPAPWEPASAGWPTSPPGFPAPPPTTGAAGPAGSNGPVTSPPTGAPPAHGWGPPTPGP